MSGGQEQEAVLVLDTRGQCGLSVVRSLGEKVTVTAGGATGRTLGMLSRHSDSSFVYPAPSRRAEAFLDTLTDHLAEHGYAAVVPLEDHTTLLLARHKERIEATGTTVATEDWPTFQRAYDKAALFDALGPLDVPTPETHAPTSMAAVRAIADSIDYPAVIKPRSKSHFRDGECVTTLVTEQCYVDSPAELRGAYARLLDRYDGLERRYPLLQEYVPGTTTTTVTVAADGEVGPYFQEERLRTYPSAGGNSALLGARSEPTMLAYAEQVLEELEWTGPAMVEFMQTPEEEFYIIEVNGRYWGSLPFAISSGVDFPWVHYCQLVGREPSRPIVPGEYRTDHRQRRLFYEDIKWLAERIQAGDVGALGPFLSDFVRARQTWFSASDPLPTVGALAQAGTLGARALARRIR